MEDPGEILVTGGRGFVGSHLVAALRAQGYVVRSISTSDGDIARADLSFPYVRHVFHLAAKMFVPDSWVSPGQFYSTNVLGTVNVLELCRRNHASLTLVSSYVYGQPKYLPVSEEHPVEAFNPYAHTKILAEEIARFFERQFRLRLTIVRPFNIFGPGQDKRFLIPTILSQALDPDVEIIRVADRRPKRDYLYVDDFIALLMATFELNASGTYNAGSGISTSIEDLVAIINQAAGTNKAIVSDDNERPGEVLDVAADISHAASKLLWMPRITLQEGIAAMADSLSHS